MFAINEIDREFDKVGLNQVVILWGATAPRTVFKNINQYCSVLSVFLTEYLEKTLN